MGFVGISPRAAAASSSDDLLGLRSLTARLAVCAPAFRQAAMALSHRQETVGCTNRDCGYGSSNFTRHDVASTR